MKENTINWETHYYANYQKFTFKQHDSETFIEMKEVSSSHPIEDDVMCEWILKVMFKGGTSVQI